MERTDEIMGAAMYASENPDLQQLIYFKQAYNADNWSDETLRLAQYQLLTVLTFLLYFKKRL